MTAPLAAAAPSRRWRSRRQRRRPLGPGGRSPRSRGGRCRLEQWSGRAAPPVWPAGLATPRRTAAAQRARREPGRVTISLPPALCGTAAVYVRSRRSPAPGAGNDRGCRLAACGRVAPGASGWQPPTSGSADSLQSMREPPSPCGWRPPAFGWAGPGAPGWQPPSGSAEPPQLICEPPRPCGRATPGASGWQPPSGSPEGPQFIREPPSHCRSRSQDCQMVAVVRSPAGEAPAADRVAADDRGGARVAASSRTSTTRRARCIEPPLPGAASTAVSTAAGAPPRTQGAGQAAEDADALCSHEHRWAASRPHLPPDRPMVCPRS